MTVKACKIANLEGSLCHIDLLILLCGVVFGKKRKVGLILWVFSVHSTLDGIPMCRFLSKHVRTFKQKLIFVNIFSDTLGATVPSAF